jgi:hypothetical protein
MLTIAEKLGFVKARAVEAAKVGEGRKRLHLRRKLTPLILSDPFNSPRL